MRARSKMSKGILVRTHFFLLTIAHAWRHSWVPGVKTTTTAVQALASTTAAVVRSLGTLLLLNINVLSLLILLFFQLTVTNIFLRRNHNTVSRDLHMQGFKGWYKLNFKGLILHLILVSRSDFFLYNIGDDWLFKGF